MTELFLDVLNSSISAGWLVLVVMVLRFLLKKAPKWVNVLLWGLVAVRLVCPVMPESALSLIPNAQTVSPGIMLDPTPAIDSGVAAVDAVVNPAIAYSFTPDPLTSANPLQIWIPVAAVIWVTGIAAMLLYTAISYWRLRRRVADAVRLRENIYQSARILSPFVLGIFRPRIYLPFGIGEPDLSLVIAHEQTHLRRKDHWWKPLGFLLLSIHWFHPLLWAAYILLCRDIELACDEKVVKALSREQRADYSQALLNCSVSRKHIAACPLAFGEVGVKQRIKNVLNYRKPGFWVILIAVTLCIFLAVCFLTNPVNSTVRNPAVRDYIPGAEGILGNVDKTVFLNASGDFAIGADRYGRAVFRDPHTAFRTFTELYALGIAHIQATHDLDPLSQSNYPIYAKYGWQTNTGTDEQIAQAAFVTRFLDIYENSFTDAVPTPDGAEVPTKQTISINDLIALSRKGYDLTWADFEDFGYEEVGHGLYIRLYPINSSYSLYIGGVPQEIPQYIRLKHEQTENYIDIREADISLFVAEQSELLREQAISDAIMTHFRADTVPGILCVESHAQLAHHIRANASENRIYEEVFYLLVQHEGFRVDGDAPQTRSSSLVPTALTFSVTHTGEYILTEYWEPRDGSYYDADLREKFPAEALEALPEAEARSEDLRADNYQKALAYMQQILGVPEAVYPGLSGTTVKAELTLGDQTLCTASDASADKLGDLIAQAQWIGYEPQTYFLGAELVLTQEDGTVLTAGLDLYNDGCMIDGRYFDYGPGMEGEASINATLVLLSLFGLEDWPEEVWDGYTRMAGPPSEQTPPSETVVPIENFPEDGSMMVWYPDLSMAEIPEAQCLAILEALASAEMVSTDQTLPALEEAVCTLHIAYHSGEEFDLACLGEDTFLFRNFQTGTVSAITSTELWDTAVRALEKMT